MKSHALAAVLAALALGACATTEAPKPASFVKFSCDSNKSFQVRFNDEAKSARIRTLEGAFELDQKAQGRFSADDWTLVMDGKTRAMVEHKGKPAFVNCKSDA